jgi:hypothetical protein
LTTPIWFGGDGEYALAVVIVGFVMCLLTAMPLFGFVYKSMKTFVFAEEKEVEG